MESDHGPAEISILLLNNVLYFSEHCYVAEMGKFWLYLPAPTFIFLFSVAFAEVESEIQLLSLMVRGGKKSLLLLTNAAPSLMSNTCDQAMQKQLNLLHLPL